MVPVVPVKYCKHPWGAFSLLLHRTWIENDKISLFYFWKFNLSNFDGKSTGGSSTAGPEVGSKFIALVWGMYIHVVTSVGPTQDRRGWNRQTSWTDLQVVNDTHTWPQVWSQWTGPPGNHPDCWQTLQQWQHQVQPLSAWSQSQGCSGQTSQNLASADKHLWHTEHLYLLYSPRLKPFTLHILSLQADPRDLEDDVKYVRFWDTDPPSQVFSKMQQTPNDEAQLPLAVPLEVLQHQSDFNMNYFLLYTHMKYIQSLCSMFHYVQK